MPIVLLPVYVWKHAVEACGGTRSYLSRASRNVVPADPVDVPTMLLSRTERSIDRSDASAELIAAQDSIRQKCRGSVGSDQRGVFR